MKYNFFKSEGVALGYSKGNKIENFIQDKFFVLLDGNIQLFCLIDGHGPYGSVIAKLIQDKLFKVFIFFYKRKLWKSYIHKNLKLITNQF